MAAPGITFTGIVGTLDELEPILRAKGFTAVRAMSGNIDLATFDPYGMRRLGSVNIKTERWAHHIYRGELAIFAGKAYIADAIRTAEPPFVNGMFELVGSARAVELTAIYERLAAILANTIFHAETLQPVYCRECFAWTWKEHDHSQAAGGAR